MLEESVDDVDPSSVMVVELDVDEVDGLLIGDGGAVVVLHCCSFDGSSLPTYSRTP